MPVPPLPLNESVARLPGGRLLGYAEFGVPDGDVVLWFPGTPGARKQLPPATPEEAVARNLRVICIERPGTGISTPYVYDSMLDYAADMADFADVLGIERFGVAGLSGGGPYVLACAYALPDRVVLACVLGGIGPTRGPETCPGYTRMLAPFSPVLHLTKGPLAFLINAALPSVRLFASTGADLYAKIAPPPDRPVLRQDDFKAMFVQDLSHALQHGIRAPVLDLYLFSRDWGFSLKDIRVPVRFWHGDADLIVPLSHSILQSELVPNSQLTIVPGGGHFSGFETVPVVLDAFQEVFSGQPQSAVVEAQP
jgi:pimeloyl-ACP methyl ester carboxylesterase